VNVKLRATDNASATTDATKTVTVSAPTPPSGDPVITAAGDFNGTSGPDPDTVAVANVMRVENPSVILGLGDFQYNCDPASYACLEAGFHQAIRQGGSDLYPLIRSTPGPTHDVGSCSTLQNYIDFWTRNPFTPYSFDVGNWHIIAMPSAAYRYGCDTTNILLWLNNDLQTNTKACTLAYWHEPYFTSNTGTHTTDDAVRPWVDALYNSNADVIVSGHQHGYERFAPQRSDRTADAARGLRQFIAGTGGVGFYPWTSRAANSEVQNADTYGALKMVLHPNGYDFQFLRAAGGSFTDSGTGFCH
jgi:hypothetical protein